MPSFEMHNKYAEEHITLRDMLCHGSGLPSMMPYGITLSLIY